MQVPLNPDGVAVEPQGWHPGGLLAQGAPCVAAGAPGVATGWPNGPGRPLCGCGAAGVEPRWPIGPGCPLCDVWLGVSARGGAWVASRPKAPTGWMLVGGNSHRMRGKCGWCYCAKKRVMLRYWVWSAHWWGSAYICTMLNVTFCCIIDYCCFVFVK